MDKASGFPDGDIPSARQITVAEIVGVYGVKGWVKLRSWTQPRENVFSYGPWHLLTKSGQPLTGYTLQKGEKKGSTLVAKLDQCDDRETAATLRGVQVTVSRDNLPDLADKEYYWNDLLGLQVVNQNGDSFGTITELVDTGANDVLVIDGDRRRMVPFVMDQYVIDIDLNNQKLVVDWDADF